jgi:hypothetical protein
MKKNVSMFFATMVVMGAFFVISAPRASAYAVGSATDTGSGSAAGSYNFSDSLQNLISPFTGFINDLKWNSGTTIKVNGKPGFTPPANLNVAPQLENLVRQWLTEFDNWFYGISGLQLSGIVYAFLSALSWVLNLANSAVNWLLGLFH